jgi:superfamily II DNA or RNA helicase
MVSGGDALKTEQYRIPAAKMSHQLVVLDALRRLSRVCDGAVAEDDVGFNGADTVFGKQLALQSTLSPKQLKAASSMLIKYERQLGEETVEKIRSILNQLIEQEKADSVKVAPAVPFDVEKVKWSEPKRVNTRGGPRIVENWEVSYEYKSPESEGFWAEWSSGRLKAAGYSISKFGNVWTLSKWSEVPAEEIEKKRKQYEEYDRQEIHTENYEPELRPALQKRFDEISARLVELGKKAGQDTSYQVPHLKRIIASLDASGDALDASDTGTGKTYVALAAAYVFNMRMLALVPKATIIPWNRVAKLLGVQLEAINYEMVRTGNTELAQWKQVSKGKRTKWTFAWNTKAYPLSEYLLAFDECHKLKDYKTQNCAMGLAAISQGYKAIAMSATAADNPLHMKFVGTLTKLFKKPEMFWGWCFDHGVEKARWGYEFVGGRDSLTRIHRQIFPMHGSRIRISELGDRFPETQIIADAYQINGATDEINRIYKEMNAAIAKLRARMEQDWRTNILTEQLRARQMTELLKIPTLVQMAQDGVAEGMKVVVFVNFEQSLVELSQKLETPYVIHGGQSDEHRQQVQDEFNRNKADFIVANIRAGGVGIGLHGKANGPMRLALICPTFSGQDLKQALGRCHRAGGARSIQKIVFAANTIEEHACDRVREKISRITLLNDGELDDALRF